jgi:viroplasmin and RNaseH domain-containing protein
LNTFLSMGEYAGKEQERMEAKTKELAMASSLFGRHKDSPTGSEEDLYFQARPVDTRLYAHQPKDPAPAAEASKPMLVPKTEMKSTLKTPPKYSSVVDKLEAMDTKFPFQVESGLGKSPSFKTLKATGLKTESMDPATVLMMSMVDQLTASMAQLASKVEDIASKPKAIPFVQKPMKPKEVAPEAAKTAHEAKSKYFYGVGHGIDGVFGVFTSWGEVGPLVVGVSKAIFQRFGTRQEAQDFVDATQALRQQQAANQPSGVPVSDIWYAVTNRKTGRYDIFLSWPAAQLHVVIVSGASVRKFRTYSDAHVYLEGHAAAWEQHLPASSPSLMSRSSITKSPNRKLSKATYHR